MSMNPTLTNDAIVRADIDRSLRHPVMFFLTSGAAWLAVSILLGLLSSAKLYSPGFLSNAGWLTYGRIFPAHLNSLVYGWGFQAAFGVILWLMARLSRHECRNVGTILAAGHVWNLAVAVGVIGILSGYGTGIPWLEFPAFVWPALLICYILILAGSFVQFHLRGPGQVYVSQWYLMAALIWFPWVYATTNILLHWNSGHPVMAAAIAAWYRSAVIFLFFVPVVLGVAYYLAPKVSGRPVFSYSLAKNGFWALAVIAPWAGMQKLIGAPIPYFLPYLAAAAGILLFIPLILAAYNILRTAASEPTTLSASPSLRFLTAGVVGLALLACATLILNWPGSTLIVTQFTLAGYGFDVLALYGSFSMIMYAAVYFIVPRITRREWLSRRLIKIHFLFSVYGLVFITLVALFGGLMQGYGQEDFRQPWSNAAGFVRPYALMITFSWCVILFSNLSFFIHLGLMWLRLGRRSSHPTLLVRPHSGESLALADTTLPSH